MKQKIFTLVILLALIVVGGKAFGQGDRWNPITTQAWDYSITGLSGTGATIYVNQSNTLPTDGSGAAGRTINSQSFDDPTNTAIANITWNTAGTYYLWATTTNGSCANRAYRTVVVTANLFDVSILALGNAGLGEATLSGWAGASEETNAVCPQFSVDYEFDAKDAGFSDGSTYTFFRLTKSDENGGTWNFTLTADAGSTAIEYWNAGTSTWDDASAAVEDILDATTQILIRVTFDNPAGFNDFDISVTATENYGTAGTLADIDPSDNAADITITAMPDISGVGFTD